MFRRSILGMNGMPYYRIVMELWCLIHLGFGGVYIFFSNILEP